MDTYILYIHTFFYPYLTTSTNTSTSFFHNKHQIETHTSKHTILTEPYMSAFHSVYTPIHPHEQHTKPTHTHPLPPYSQCYTCLYYFQSIHISIHTNTQHHTTTHTSIHTVPIVPHKSDVFSAHTHIYQPQHTHHTDTHTQIHTYTHHTVTHTYIRTLLIVPTTTSAFLHSSPTSAAASAAAAARCWAPPSSAERGCRSHTNVACASSIASRNPCCSRSASSCLRHTHTCYVCVRVCM